MKLGFWLFVLVCAGCVHAQRFPAVIDPSTLWSDGTSTYDSGSPNIPRVRGARITSANQLSEIRTAFGDVNGDGRDDIVVGVAGAGVVNIIHGTSAVLPQNSTVAGLSASTVTGPGSIGWSLDIAGDMNGDGFSDLVIANRGGTTTNGAYVVFGSAAGIPSLSVSTLNGTNGFALRASGGGCEWRWF